MENKLIRISFFFIGFLSSFLIFSTIGLYSQQAKVRVIKDQAVLRLKPSNGSIIIRELPLGSELIVEETVGEWIKIKMPPDTDGIVITGYIHKSFVEFEIKQPQLEQEKKSIITETPPKINLSIKDMDKDFISWEKQLNSAKGKKKDGTIVSIIGAAITGIGGVLYLVSSKEVASIKYYDYEISATEGERNNNLLMIPIGGAVIAIIGGVIYGMADTEFRRLELEGAKKGYDIAASLNIINGGLAFQITLTF